MIKNWQFNEMLLIVYFIFNSIDKFIKILKFSKLCVKINSWNIWYSDLELKIEN